MIIFIYIWIDELRIDTYRLKIDGGKYFYSLNHKVTVNKLTPIFANDNSFPVPQKTQKP